MTTKINLHISVGAVKCVELNGKTVNSSLVTSEELQTHQGEVEPHPKARCPVSPETPPRSAQGSSEQELQHHTSSEEAERSLQEVVDALQEGIKQQSVRKIFMYPTHNDISVIRKITIFGFWRTNNNTE